MKNLIALLFLLPLLVCCSTDKKEIEDCFETYKANVLSNNGAKAVECLARQTLDYYAGILEDARHATKKTVYNKNLIDRLMILKTRNQIPKDSINAFSTKSYISYAITNGIIGNESVKQHEFLEVKEVNGKEAKARVKLLRDNKVIIFKFTKEKTVWNQEGAWKIDLIPLMSIGYKAMKVDIARKGISEDQYVMAILQATNDNYVKPDVWKPTMDEK